MKALYARLLVATTTALVPVFSFAQQTYPDWDRPGPWHMWSGWALWWLFPLCMLFMFGICVAIFFFARRTGAGHHHWISPWHMMKRGYEDSTHSALRILNERYAKGEIQKLEYEERKATILSRGN